MQKNRCKNLFFRTNYLVCLVRFVKKGTSIFKICHFILHNSKLYLCRCEPALRMFVHHLCRGADIFLKYLNKREAINTSLPACFLVNSLPLRYLCAREADGKFINFDPIPKVYQGYTKYWYIEGIDKEL